MVLRAHDQRAVPTQPNPVGMTLSVAHHASLLLPSFTSTTSTSRDVKSVRNLHHRSTLLAQTFTRGCMTICGASYLAGDGRSAATRASFPPALYNPETIPHAVMQSPASELHATAEHRTASAGRLEHNVFFKKASTKNRPRPTGLNKYNAPHDANMAPSVSSL